MYVCVCVCVCVCVREKECIYECVNVSACVCTHVLPVLAQTTSAREREYKTPEFYQKHQAFFAKSALYSISK